MPELLNKEDREDHQAVVEDGPRIIYLSFLTRRTERTTSQLPGMDMRITYLSFLTRRTERTTRQLSRMDPG